MLRLITPLDRLKQQAWNRRAALAKRREGSGGIERLEPRHLLAASITDRVLTVTGTGGADVISLTRSGADDVIANVNGTTNAFDMDDFDLAVLSGVGGGDQITNANGINNVSLIGGSGADRLSDGDGNNTLKGDGGDDTLVAGAGNDSLSGGGGTDTVDYSARTVAFTFDLDTFNEGDAKATTSGETDTFATFEPFPEDEGDDIPDLEVYIGSQAADSFRMDRYIDEGLTVHYVFDGRGGNDTFTVDGYLSSITYTAIGGDGNDLFRILTNTHSTVIGGAGDDVFEVDEDSGSPEFVDGGAGTDLITFAYVNTPDVVDLNDYTSVENGSSQHAGVLLIGTPGNNRLEITGGGTIRGGAGNDTLIGSDDGGGGVSLLGEEGNDSIVGGEGDDTLDGGPGIDTLVGGGGGGNDTLLNGEASSPIEGGILYGYGTQFNDVISLIRSGADDVVLTVNGSSRMFDMDDFFQVNLDGIGGDDRISVADGINRVSLFGGAGNDRLIDGNGGNTLNGAWGDDTLVCGLGPDIMIGGDGRDTADYSARTANLSFNLGPTVGPSDDGAFGENDEIDTDVERVLGGSGNDRFVGNDDANTFIGGGGNDTMDGAGGDDALHGEGGDDLLIGGTGDDFVDGGSGADFLSGREDADTLLGQSGNDRLFANDGVADTVNGGSDSDTATLDGGGVDSVSNVETFA